MADHWVVLSAAQRAVLRAATLVGHWAERRVGYSAAWTAAQLVEK